MENKCDKKTKGVDAGFQKISCCTIWTNFKRNKVRLDWRSVFEFCWAIDYE